MSELRALVPWPRLPAAHEVDRLRRQCEALIRRNAELEAQAKPENPKVIQSLKRCSLVSRTSIPIGSIRKPHETRLLPT